MQELLPFLRTRKKKTTGVLRVKQNEVEFVFFRTEAEKIQVVSYGIARTSSWDTEELLEKIFTETQKQGTIEELVVTFPADQFRAHIIEEKIAPSLSKHIITEKEARALEREVRQRVQRTFHRRLLQETGILPEEFALRRVKILGCKIDGYQVAQLAGYKRGEVAFSVLGLFLLEPLFLAVEQVARKHRIVKLQVSHIAEALAEYAKARQQNGVYLAIEESHTQVALWKDGELRFPGVIPAGESAFRQAVQEQFGVGENAAQEFLQRYTQGALSPEVRERVQAASLPELQKFGTLVKEKLLQAHTSLPGRIWILGRGGLIHDPVALFGETPEEDLPFLQPPTFSLLFPKDVWPNATFFGKQNPIYSPLCLLGAGAIS